MAATPLRTDEPFRTLYYLLDVAQKTEGAEVWRALFAEMMRGLEGGAGSPIPRQPIPRPPSLPTARPSRPLPSA